MNREKELIVKSKQMMEYFTNMIEEDETLSVLDFIYILSMTSYIFLASHNIKVEDYVKALNSCKEHFQNNFN